MKLEHIANLIRRIVNESLDALEEGFQAGEWWIHEDGSTTYADGDVGDSNHEAVVINYVIHEILDHFGIHSDEAGYLTEYEPDIKQDLIDDGRLTPEQIQYWDQQGGYEILQKILFEDKLYPTEEQADEAVRIAYGSRSSTNSTLDARNYGMKYLGWKIMKNVHGRLEVDTWTLTPGDLESIVRGVWDVMDDYDDEEEKDPVVNLTIESRRKVFHNIPLSVLEKKVPSAVMNYQSGLHSDFMEGLNEDYHVHHKEYRLYEGSRKIVAVFDDNSRLMFEVHFRHNRGEDREKWRHKAMTKWKTLANELHSDVPLSDACNPIQKSWKECFAEALKNPEMEEFIRDNHHQQIFPDKGYPASVQGKPQSVVDPVNFTPRK